MTTPYRNELDALRQRKESLEREIADIHAQAIRLEELRGRQSELQRELDGITSKMGASARRLPMLDDMRVASPCPAKWDDMLGDDRVRFCTSCDKNVFNLSAMSRDEAESLLQDKLGKDLCVRYYQRADGTVITDDCPVGVKRKRRRKVILAGVGAAAAVFGATTALATTTCTTGKMVQGGAAWQGEPTVSTAPTVTEDPKAPPAPSDTTPPPPTRRSPVMGKR